MFGVSGLDKNLERLAKSCISCQSVKQGPLTALLYPWVWPSGPWQWAHIDFAGPIGGHAYLVLVDAHSKWPEVIYMPSTTATRTIEALRSIFASYGLPLQLVSDNGPQFSSAEFKDFLIHNGIKHLCSAPYHPATSGLAERFIQSLKKALLAAKQDCSSLSQRLSNFLLMYRTTPHATTREAPSV